MGTELSLSRPLLSPVFLRDGRKVRETWERALGTVLVIPFPDLSFLACFCSVAESVGRLGGAGFAYRVICFQASLTCLSLRKTREKEESGKG